MSHGGFMKTDLTCQCKNIVETHGYANFGPTKARENPNYYQRFYLN